MTNEEKTQALLGSPAGCFFILDVSANLHLPLERFAKPEVSFWLAAMTITSAESQGWHQIAFRESKPLGDLALKIVSNPAFDWWYEPVDLESQIWSSPLMPHGSDRDPPEPRPFTPERWRRPAPPDADDDELIPSVFGQVTSTFRGSSTSEWTAFATGAGDHICAFPLAAWRRGAGTRNQPPGGLARALPGVSTPGPRWPAGSQLA